MTKYKWDAARTLEYLAIKKPDLVITTEIWAGFKLIAQELKTEIPANKMTTV